MLLLVPASVLVLVVLGAIAVDSAVVLLGQRELANAAAAAANDAATVALDLGALRGDDRLRLDPDRARAVAAGAAARQIDGVVLDADGVRVRVDGLRVTVTLRGTVEHVFARAVPGASRRTSVAASATAVLRGGAG